MALKKTKRKKINRLKINKAAQYAPYVPGYKHKLGLFNAMSRALRQSELIKRSFKKLSHTSRDLLTLLIDLSMTYFQVAPSFEFIGDCLGGKHRETIRQAMMQLEEYGLIHRTRVSVRHTWTITLNPAIFEHHILERIVTKIFPSYLKRGKKSLVAWMKNNPKRKGILLQLLDAYQATGKVLNIMEIYQEKKAFVRETPVRGRNAPIVVPLDVFEDILLRKKTESPAGEPVWKKSRLPKILSKFGLAIVASYCFVCSSSLCNITYENKEIGEISQYTCKKNKINDTKYPKGYYQHLHVQHYEGNPVDQDLLDAFPDSYSDNWIPLYYDPSSDSYKSLDAHNVDARSLKRKIAENKKKAAEVRAAQLKKESKPDTGIPLKLGIPVMPCDSFKPEGSDVMAATIAKSFEINPKAKAIFGDYAMIAMRNHAVKKNETNSNTSS